ncbi:helix-turn-helix transcriptional regulator [Providencia alcalifaciens]|uniref:helix-turn-helix transcriptional regulator n=1 Tax=Providencia alcalifaciens TaxID=126385 RepID=UPI003D96A8BF
MNDRIIRINEVLQRTGLSRATIYRLMKADTFPKNKKLTGDAGRAKGWFESEINFWISRRE